MKTLIKKLLRENIDDFFNDYVPMEKLHGKVVDTKNNVELITIPLYRGIRNKIELIKHQDGYILDNTIYPDNAIWFTKDKNFADNYNNDAIVTYNLELAKHSIIKIYSDGFSEEKSIYGDDVIAVFNHTDVGVSIGDSIASDISNDWPFYGSLELPDYWYFSYKVQKHIVCKTKLHLSKNMIKFYENTN
jgi:hypothetical protein